MAKYKQAITIISNAPPLRLTYPKFARTSSNPAICPSVRYGFQRVADAETHSSRRSTGERTEASITQALTRHRERDLRQKDRKEPVETGKIVRWEAARPMESSIWPSRRPVSRVENSKTGVRSGITR